MVARLILTDRMARVASPELVQRLKASLRLFPDLGDDAVTVGVTASRWLDGLAFPAERHIRLNPFRRRNVTYHTIGHELTHLLQPPGLGLIPSGEVQCDIWTLARDPLFLDEKPTYLDVDCDGRSWRKHARAVGRMCQLAIDERTRKSTLYCLATLANGRLLRSGTGAARFVRAVSPRGVRSQPRESELH